MVYKTLTYYTNSIESRGTTEGTVNRLKENFREGRRRMVNQGFGHDV